MNGEQKSYKEMLSSFEQILNAYNNSVGSDRIIYNKSVEDVLLMGYKELKNLDKQGCEEYSYLLAQYSAVLIKEQNRNSVRLIWAQDHLNRLIANNYDKYVGDRMMKFDLVKYMIINNDTAASYLNDIILHASARQQELNELSSKVYYMSSLLRDIGRNK